MLIDTHVHFGGSIPVETIWEIVKSTKAYYLADSLEEVKEAVVYDGGGGFDGFLDKFKILDEITWDEKILDISIKAVAESFKLYDFIWLDFSINKYMRYMKMRKHELIQYFYDKFEEYLPGKVALVLSIKYESLEASKRTYMKIIEDPRVVNLLAGIDLVGDESKFNVDDFNALKDWKKAGKMVRIHVGEMGHDSHVYKALKHLPITNIAHGIDIIDDQRSIDLALEKEIQFDLAITSNLKIRKMKIKDHPIFNMHELGLKLTLGSDDPTIFKTDLQHEYNTIKRKEIREACIKQAIQFCNQYGYLR